MASKGDKLTAPAWDAARLAGDPHKVADKQRRVGEMFTSIAHAYDLNNRLHSLWMDQHWRRCAVGLAAPGPQCDVLDVACGTGDLTEAFARRGVRSVVGLDYTPAMLEVARGKWERHRKVQTRVEYIQGDAQALPFADASFDIVSIAFGIRNVADPMQAIREFRRVLRPAGRLVILEFSQPRSRIVQAIHGFYTSRLMPWTATLLSRDRTGAYHYLPRSVETFLGPEDLAKGMSQSGFDHTSHHPMTMGTCTITLGRLN